MHLFPLIISISFINVIYGLDTSDNKLSSKKTARYFNPLVSVVNFPNDPCTGVTTKYVKMRPEASLVTVMSFSV